MLVGAVGVGDPVRREWVEPGSQLPRRELAALNRGGLRGHRPAGDHQLTWALPIAGSQVVVVGNRVEDRPHVGR